MFINEISKVLTFILPKLIWKINELDEIYFTQIYHKFYSYKDERIKFKIDDIQKVLIENGDYGSKCFNLLVDNTKYPLSIKRFIN
jgi:hypothetical protein